LRISERLHLDAPKRDQAEGNALPQQRNIQHGPEAELPSGGAALWVLLCLGLQIGHLNRSSVEHRASSDCASNGGHDEPRHDGNGAMVSHNVEGAAAQSEDGGVISGAQARGALGHGVQHGLQVGRGARDDPEDVGRRGLLLQSFTHLRVGFGQRAVLILEFRKQAHIFDGDHCLVREGLEQCDLGRREAPGLGARDADDAENLSPTEYRDEQLATIADDPRETAPCVGDGGIGLDVDEATELRAANATEYVRRARASIALHVEGMLEYVRAGSYVFDYGNNLRSEAADAGVEEAFSYPGFVPAYIRPLFCRGVGPFRWVALSGDAEDITAIDEELRRLFVDDVILQRWLQLAPERVAFQGLPARICWLGLGDRARAGLAINDLVRSGRVRAPVVIGRDHLDSGSVASPYRETEGMRDGSDAIADWPILNALLNTAAGATWVSVHHGGGVGIGNSIHAGMVVVADGTDDAAERLERVLTTDPGTGVLRHADAGYDEAIAEAERQGLELPMRPQPGA